MNRFEVVDRKRLFSFFWIVLGHVAAGYLLVTAQWLMLFYAWLVSLCILHLGISITYHRSISHSAAKLPSILENIGIFIGGMSLQGSPIDWCAVHRQHHAKHGTELDPHSPKNLGSWYVQIFGYAFCKVQTRYVAALAKNPTYVFWRKYYYWIYLPFIILPLFFMPFDVAVALFWAPIGISYQFEGTVNTWAHKWDEDIPQNTFPVWFFIGGEAYHENHHTYPNKARFGKYDMAGWLLTKLAVK